MSIPNTLSIFINTRIRGNSKIKYSPDMSVENNKNTQVYFDPLIKLNYYSVNYVPKGLPESEKFTQFFSKGEFNSLIQRTLGSGSQVKRDLVKATEDGTINNNIRVTLDTLFHTGNPFYLNGKHFTIHSYEWETGDWEIQSTKSEKMKKALSPYIGNNREQNFTRYRANYDSNLTYYIVINLELYPGDHIPLSARASIACQARYEKIRKSYADLFGLVYQPKELKLSEDMNKKYIASKSKTKKEIGGSHKKNNNTRRR